MSQLTQKERPACVKIINFNARGLSLAVKACSVFITKEMDRTKEILQKKKKKNLKNLKKKLKKKSHSKNKEDNLNLDNVQCNIEKGKRTNKEQTRNPNESNAFLEDNFNTKDSTIFDVSNNHNLKLIADDVDCLSKGLGIYYFINLNKWSIFTITETKLKEELEYSFSVLFQKDFWIFFNSSGESKAGTITMIPKRMFEKPTFKVMEKGMVSSADIKTKDDGQFGFKLITYYNPDPKTFNQVSKSTFEKVKKEQNVVISGDFNEIIDFEIDYESKNPGGIKETTKKKKIERANNFQTEVRLNKLNFLRNVVPFTFESPKMKSTVDWFFFDNQLKSREPQIKRFELPFKADHFGIQLSFVLEKSQEEKKEPKAFRPPDHILHDVKFKKRALVLIERILKEKASALEKLEKICTNISNLALNFVKSLNRKRKKEMEKMFERFMRSKNKIENKLCMIESADQFEEETRKQFVKMKFDRETSKGPSKELSNFLKKNNRENQIKSPEFLFDNDGNIKKKWDAANLASEEMEALYTSEQICVDSFENLDFGNSLSDQEKKKLQKPFTTNEVLEAIKKTPNRATGPSGMPITFFKIFANQMAPLLCKIANQINESGEASEFLLNRNVIFIPKKKESQYVKDLRPITLLEIPRKIITKMMTDRLKQALLKEKIVNDSQFCHPGRRIHDNVLTLKFLMEMTIKSKKEKEKNNINTNEDDLHILFVDFSKAFDRCNHFYIKKVLEKKNFGPKSIKFIEAFLKGYRKVDFNGYESKSFWMGRGIPQGETLSPFLFVLSLDPLLSKIQNDNSIVGVEIKENKNTKSLGYADDIAFTARRLQDLNKMLDHTKTYCKASNALISVEKSELVSIGEQISQVQGIKQSTERVRHLGFFLNSKGFINNIDEIIDKALICLNLLKRRFLCLTVQINIIKGYLYSKLIYQAPVLTITKEQVKKINNIINWFLYHKDRNTLRYDPIKKYYCAISIKRLSYSKKNGGRNLYNIKEIFGAAKSKTIIVLTREENKDNSCAILLNNLLDDSFDSQKNDPNFFVFSNHVESVEEKKKKNSTSTRKKKKNGNDNKDLLVGTIKDSESKNWKEIEWISEARITHRKIEIIPTTINPSKGKGVWNIVHLKHKTETPFSNIKLQAEKFTIPISDFWKETPTKTNSKEWRERVKFEYKNKSLNKEKISFGMILRQSEPKEINLSPAWTKGQWKWFDLASEQELQFPHLTKRLRSIENVSTTLSKSLKTLTRVDDFKTKVLLNYFSYTTKLGCCFCSEDIEFSIWHWLFECVITEKWENVLHFNQRKRRKESMFNVEDPNHTYSWIVSWCLWKEYNKIYHQLTNAKTSPYDFLQTLKSYEKAHLEFLKEKKYLLGKKKEEFLKQLFYFSFYKFDKDLEIERFHNPETCREILKQI